jgi:hypothetical protein
MLVFAVRQMQTLDNPKTGIAMSTRKIVRKKPSNLTFTIRRPAPALRFTRIERSIKVVVPPDCSASVILKQVAHDDRRHYAWWLLVGRYDQDAMTVSYKYTGEDTVRCDIPTGIPLSAAAMQSHLARFLKSEGTQEDKPPIIK